MTAGASSEQDNVYFSGMFLIKNTGSLSNIFGSRKSLPFPDKEMDPSTQLDLVPCSYDYSLVLETLRSLRIGLEQIWPSAYSLETSSLDACFVPTFSSLAISEDLANDITNHDKFRSYSASDSPFDYIIGGKDNHHHLRFQEGAIEEMLQHLGRTHSEDLSENYTRTLGQVDRGIVLPKDCQQIAVGSSYWVTSLDQTMIVRKIEMRDGENFKVFFENSDNQTASCRVFTPFQPLSELDTHSDSNEDNTFNQSDSNSSTDNATSVATNRDGVPYCLNSENTSNGWGWEDFNDGQGERSCLIIKDDSESSTANSDPTLEEYRPGVPYCINSKETTTGWGWEDFNDGRESRSCKLR